MSAKDLETGLIVLDGDIHSALPWIEWNSYDLRIAVDGAYDRLRSRSLTPEILIGDLDSVSQDGLEHARNSGVKVLQSDDQETTDSQKALAFILERGVPRLDVVGFRGTRLDHELATLSAVANVSHRLKIRLIDQTAEGWMLTGPANRELRNVQNRTCSLMPITLCEGVSLAGFRWPLSASRLTPGGAFACSNVVESPRASIALTSGILLLYLHHADSDQGENAL